ncbi:N-acetylglutamate synthase-like GNAT family acetyltransferase [Sphingomonas sp. BE138]|uniref:GNAT family N-acetyltransferase n=1 Tax=Sphingomonas sp. BE138 TaxID=2817845 RepID=UPI00285F8092|nr:GNAT family N-acetyltransferase [Sphingomonas sp. BE138]MDR6786847.1 N-acetylglutamate synthase-like GNAT family acetyltransferase [Sphingomonas sp. BE138]
MPQTRIRRLQERDRLPTQVFAAGVPEHDLLFLGRDLRQPRVIAAWLEAIAQGWIDGLVAEEDGALVGTAALVRDPLSWSAHVGEIRLLVAPDRRGTGLGHDLLQAVMQIAATHGLAKLTVAMTADRVRTLALFDSLGFVVEARLRDHVRDGSGTPHDLVVLAHHAAG